MPIAQAIGEYWSIRNGIGLKPTCPGHPLATSNILVRAIHTPSISTPAFWSLLLGVKCSHSALTFLLKYLLVTLAHVLNWPDVSNKLLSVYLFLSGQSKSFVTKYFTLLIILMYNPSTLVISSATQTPATGWL